MPDAHARHKLVRSLVVTRADGTVEDLGIVGVHHPDKHLHNRFQRLLERGQHFTEEHVLNDNPPRLKPRKKGA